MKKFPSVSISPAASIATLRNIAKTGSAKISVVGAIAGAGMDMISATRDERAYLADLVDEYRPEIAKRSGLAEKQVTAEHFDAAFKENPVLVQAKETTSMKRAVRIVSSSVSVVFGIVAGIGAAFLVRRGQETEGMQENAASIAGTLAASFGGWSAGKFTRKVLHSRKLDDALGGTAHNQIMIIKNKQQLGQPTDAADIFKVQLAVNPQVSEAIQQAFGKPFGQLGAEEQQQLLKDEFPEVLKINNEMARRINEGARPQGLLFADVEDVRAKETEKKSIGQVAAALPSQEAAAQPQAATTPYAATPDPSVTQELQAATPEQAAYPPAGIPVLGEPPAAYAAEEPEAIRSAIHKVLRDRDERPMDGHARNIEHERAQQQASPQEVTR